MLCKMANKMNETLHARASNLLIEVTIKAWPRFYVVAQRCCDCIEMVITMKMRIAIGVTFDPALIINALSGLLLVLHQIGWL